MSAVYKVGIIGCGRLGQEYAEVYQAFPETEVIAIADTNPARLRIVGKRFEVDRLYPDGREMLAENRLDIVSVVTPTKYTTEAVILAAQSGAKAVTVDKPIAAHLSEADAMVDACASQGVIFAGGNLQRAMYEVQEAVEVIRSPAFGDIQGAGLFGFGNEISGGGCQAIAVLRLFLDAEVSSVWVWGTPQSRLGESNDVGLSIDGSFAMDNGIPVQVHAHFNDSTVIDIWGSNDTVARWNARVPRFCRGFDARGRRKEWPHTYRKYDWGRFWYMGATLRSVLKALETGSRPSVTGHDLRQSLEVAIASKLSAQRMAVPIKLPLEDRNVSLYPAPHRWIGGDESGNPQSEELAASPYPFENFEGLVGT